MTNAQIVALGVRLFCIWLALYLLRQAPALLSITAREMPGAATAVVVISIALVFITVALWFFPLAVARRLLPKATLDEPTPLPIDQLQRAGFCLLGLWMLTEAIPGLVYSAVMVFYASRPNPVMMLDPYNYASMAQTFVMLAIGIWLLFGARGLIGVITWARSAGTGEPSNSVVESDARQEAPRAPHHGR